MGPTQTTTHRFVAIAKDPKKELGSQPVALGEFNP